VEWDEARRFLTELNPNARRVLLALLTATPEVRAEAIGRVYSGPGGEPFAKLLIELEEKEWARQWFILRLQEMSHES
jgi:hypothetical protein